MAISHVAFVFFLLLLNLAGHRGEVSTAGQQQHDPPTLATDGLLVVKLKGADGDEAQIAAHRHDLSFAGFANRTHHWHVFRGVDEDVIPNATPLPFRNTYLDLIGGLNNLPDLPLGRASMARAVGVLASYDPHTAGEEETAALKQAVAVMSASITERARVMPVKETVSNGWEGEVRVRAEHLRDGDVP